MDYFRIRPHHGMCILFFEGKGYSSNFVAHMEKIIAFLKTNPLIILTKETDEICKACPHNQKGVCEVFDKSSYYDEQVLLHCGLSAGTVTDWYTFQELVIRSIIKAEKRSLICSDCQWNSICQIQSDLKTWKA